MNKMLYLLIGPKGSGKTYIGTYINDHTDIHFLRVEPIWVSLEKHENGWQKVTEAIRQRFLQYDRVMVENLGAGKEFNHFLSTMQREYTTRLIKVTADLPLCFRRVQERNSANHIPVSDDKVQEYNERASRVQLDWDCIVENNGSQRMEDIQDKIISL